MSSGQPRPRQLGNQTMAWAEDDMKIVQDMAAQQASQCPMPRYGL